MKMKLDHIGIVVADIAQSLQYYQTTFGAQPLSDIIDEPAHDVQVMFLATGHGPMPTIELISPLTQKSKVSGFLNKTGGGIHHLAYEVANINSAIEHFKQQGAFILGDIVPGAGHNNTPTVWLYTQQKDLVELIEAQHDH